MSESQKTQPIVDGPPPADGLAHAAATTPNSSNQSPGDTSPESSGATMDYSPPANTPSAAATNDSAKVPPRSLVTIDLAAPATKDDRSTQILPGEPRPKPAVAEPLERSKQPAADGGATQLLSGIIHDPRQPAVRLARTIDLGRPQPRPDATIDHGLRGDGDDTFELAPASGETGDTVTVPGYEILGELGRGGMGVVYRARQIGAKRIVALKMVLAGAHASPDQLKRFRVEAESVARLEHANIVHVWEVGERDGLPYFSLEFVDGGPLDKKLDGKPLAIDEAARLLETLSRAMGHAHERGIVHRDLKPANVLLKSDGTPKITDFGLAKQLEGESSQTRSGAILGTPSYMAPEQAQGDTHHIGPLTDVWALGAILYEFLTGRPPFLAATAMDTVMQVVREEPVPPSRLQSRVPRDLETICLKCLQKEPAKRYSDAIELADDVHRFIIGEPILARPVSPRERLVRWCKRNPRVAVLGGTSAALLVACAVGGPLMALQINEERKLAVEAKKTAETNEQLARNAEGRAQRNESIAIDRERTATEQADHAMDALKTLADEVGQQLRDRPDLLPLRTQLIRTAMDRLDKILKTGVRAGLADRTGMTAHLQLGDSCLMIGQRDEGLGHYEAAYEIGRKLHETEPQGDKARGNLAVVLGKLAVLNAATDLAAAKEQVAEAIRLQRELVDSPSGTDLDPAAMKRNLAGYLDQMGSLLSSSGGAAAARLFHEESHEIRVVLSVASPKDLEFQRAVADSYGRLGILAFKLSELDAMKNHFKNCVDIREALARAQPASIQFKQDLARSCGEFGDMCLFIGNFPDALFFYEKGLKEATEVAKPPPPDPRYENQLAAMAIAHYRVATAILKMNEPAKALEEYRKCLAIRVALHKSQPQLPGRQIDLMIVQARCGEHDAAASIAKRLREDGKKSWRALKQVACCYALCVDGVIVARASDSLTDAENQKRDEYRSLAIESLSQAVSVGYRDVSDLDAEPDLDPIRDDDQFKAIVAELKRR